MSNSIVKPTRNKGEYIASGTIADVVSGKFYGGDILIRDGKIIDTQINARAPKCVIVPGLVDAHIHIESSMVTPAQFARTAFLHGTMATVSDPHEIANVLGMQGIEYMLQSAREVPMHIHFGAPSCVPATGFETSGATLGPGEVETLLRRPDIGYLSEMMNYPGVLFNDTRVMEKIAIAKRYGKPIDGHAPGLRGAQAKAYADAGITTEHECTTLEEALDKIGAGMKILIREGSAAKNFDALINLLHTHPDQVMWCSDDKHPDELLHGHINLLVRRSIEAGVSPMSALRAATLNPVRHYNLPIGLLQIGDSADFTVLNRLEECEAQEVWLAGKPVMQDGEVHFPEPPNEGTPNVMRARPIHASQLLLEATSSHVNVIVAINGQIVTGAQVHAIDVKDGFAQINTEKDLLKMVVLNRYTPAPPGIAFVNGFGLKRGAIASTVAHDSHNIIAVGTSDDMIAAAINTLIEIGGGLCAVSEDQKVTLPLPLAGLMSTRPVPEVAEAYTKVDLAAKRLGSQLTAPFMTLSFMALPVIPTLKLTDKGLFDGEKFAFTPLFV